MIAHWPTLSELDRGEPRERDSTPPDRARRRRLAAQRTRPGELYRRRKLADALELAAKHEYELSQNAVRFLAAGQATALLGWLGLGMVAIAALAGVAWLARTPVRDAWLRHEAEALSPAVRLAGGPAIVGPATGGSCSALLVDVHEVSNQQYRYCVQALCPPPDEPADAAHFANGNRSLPVVYVTAYDAAQFCPWIGRRLPTEPEWERIARDKRRPVPLGQYPAYAGSGQRHPGRPQPSGLVPVHSPAFESGESGDGVEQLIGNVQEWTATLARYAPNNVHLLLLGNWNGRARVPAPGGHRRQLPG